MTLSIYTTHFDHDDALAFTVVAESEDDARTMIKEEYAGLFDDADRPGIVDEFGAAVDAVELERFDFERQIVSWVYDTGRVEQY